MTQNGSRQPVVVSTSKGTVTVPRRVYDHFAAKMQPDDLGLLHSYDWWMQASELVTGIRFAARQDTRRQGWLRNPSGWGKTT